MTTRATCLLVLCRALLAVVPVFAQAPAPVQAPADPAPAPNYFFPDLPTQALVHDGKDFWIRPIFAIVGDYTAFSQDDASLAQVGEQENTRELRAGRLGLNVRSKSRLSGGVVDPDRRESSLQPNHRRRRRNPSEAPPRRR